MISVICCTMREDFMDNVFENYKNQDYEEKELIIILNRDEMNLDKWEKKATEYNDVSIYKLSGKVTLGECLNYGISLSKYDTIAKFDDDDYYMPNYLTQQMKALNEMDVDLVCKRTVYMYFQKNMTLALHLYYKDVNQLMTDLKGIKGATLVFKKKLIDEVRFPALNRGEDSSFLKTCMQKNYKIFITDKKNYVCLRRSEKHHTWNVDNDLLMRHSRIICKTSDYKKFIHDNKIS